MRATLPLGRWFGVPVGANAGILVILALIGTALAVWHFPSVYPGRPAWAYAAAGLAAAALLVVSILLHELAHAVVARAGGIEVEQIVLWLLGGVAQLRGEPRTPGVDLAVAIVGPATSVLLGGVFGLSAGLWLTLIGSGLVSATLSYLAVLNVVLAVFNLIPAAPLDGGRILRAAIWAWRGDQYVATVWAARAGRLFGFTLIALGLVQAMTGLGGLWYILLGLFIVTMAGAEEYQARTTAALAGVRVRDVMTPQPETVPGDLTVARFLHDVLLFRRHSAFPLVDAFGRVEGLITLNRIRSLSPEERATALLRQVACPVNEVPTAAPDELLTDLLPRLGGCADGRALVFERGRLVGIVSPTDISRAAALHGLTAEIGSGGPDISPGHPWSR